MKTWLGLLGAPTVVLGAQSAEYALVQFACHALGADRLAPGKRTP